jgi:hypothetical protein
MEFTKTIKNLQNQNNGIYNSITKKGVKFVRHQYDENSDPETIIQVLTLENTQLKEISNSLKPVKEVKAKEVKIIEVEIDKIEDDDKEKDEEYIEKIKEYGTIMNLENAKRNFFAKEYDKFTKEINNKNLKFYLGKYNYSSHLDGNPEYMAKNLLRGFVRTFEDYKKYFMISFRCIKLDNGNYEYVSLWIVNTESSINEIVKDIFEDHTLVSYDGDIKEFCDKLREYRDNNSDDENTNLVGELFLH